MRNQTIVAVGFMLAGMILIPVGDSLAKIVLNTTPYSPMLVAWVRFLIGGIVVLPFALSISAFNWKDATFLKMQLVRSVLIVLTVVTIIKAVGMSPLANVFGAFFIGPILSVVLSSWFLKERTLGCSIRPTLDSSIRSIFISGSSAHTIWCIRFGSVRCASTLFITGEQRQLRSSQFTLYIGISSSKTGNTSTGCDFQSILGRRP